jgi:transcriptional regulator GlxA family with amidase domain
MEMLALANTRAKALSPQGYEPLTVTLVAESGASIRCQGGLTLQGSTSLNLSDKYDCVIIGAIGPPSDVSLNFSQETLSWLKTQYQFGARLASVCTGAFLLAATGLLNGRQATTHWAMAAEFQNMYPEVMLDPAQMVTCEPQLWCSGGASSYQDITLLLIRDYLGEQVAEQVAKLMLIDLDRESQLKYRYFIPSRQHTDAVIHQVQDRLDQDAIHTSVKQLADQVHLSERQFKRRFKQATGQSPLAYLQALRIEHAKRALSHTNRPVEQLAREVGYEDVRFFRKLFKRLVGVSPSEFREGSRF